MVLVMGVLVTQMEIPGNMLDPKVLSDLWSPNKLVVQVNTWIYPVTAQAYTG